MTSDNLHGEHKAHAARFAARGERVRADRASAKALIEKRIESLIFEMHPSASMWEKDALLHKTADGYTEHTYYTRRFTPPLEANPLYPPQDAIQECLRRHGIVDPEETKRLDTVPNVKFLHDDAGNLTTLKLSASAFEKVREDMIAPTILRDFQGTEDKHNWHMVEHGDIQGGRAYFKTFRPALQKKNSKVQREPTLLGEIVLATMDKLGLKYDQDFAVGQDGRTLIVASGAYQEKIHPFLPQPSQEQHAR